MQAGPASQVWHMHRLPQAINALGLKLSKCSWILDHQQGQEFNCDEEVRSNQVARRPGRLPPMQSVTEISMVNAEHHELNLFSLCSRLEPA